MKILSQSYSNLEQILSWSINKTGVYFVTVENNKLRKNQLDKIMIINIDAIKIPCASLDSEFEFCNLSGRRKDKGKATLIKNFLSCHNKL